MSTAQAASVPPPPTAIAPPNSLRKAAWAGLIGTTLENYDFVIYGTASALIFGKLFFPNVSPVVGVIASFSTYAVGFGARPVGGMFFSRYGDRLGRKFVLIATLLLMGTATLSIGFLPTYNRVGILAPILLLACRILQGLGAGAEQAGGMVLLAETASRNKRGRYSSLVMVGAAAGAGLGAIAWIFAQRLSDEALLSWGWRVIFWSSILVTILAMILRRTLNESPVFQELKQQHARPKTPITAVLRHGRKPLLRVFFINVGGNAHSYTYQVFIATYLVTVLKVDEHLIPPMLLVGALFAMVSAFTHGWLTDSFGRRIVNRFVLVTLTLLPVPAFLMLNTKSTPLIFLTITLGYIVAVQGTVGSQTAWFPEMFGNRYRYAGVAIGREFSSVFGGGVAPLICASLLGFFSKSWIPIAIYMMLIAGVSLAVAWSAPETRGRDMTKPEDADGDDWVFDDRQGRTALTDRPETIVLPEGSSREPVAASTTRV